MRYLAVPHLFGIIRTNNFVSSDFSATNSVAFSFAFFGSFILLLTSTNNQSINHEKKLLKYQCYVGLINNLFYRLQK